jgi:hypothetical protein
LPDLDHGRVDVPCELFPRRQSAGSQHPGRPARL